MGAVGLQQLRRRLFMLKADIPAYLFCAELAPVPDMGISTCKPVAEGKKSCDTLQRAVWF